MDRELAAYGSIDSADALALLDRNEDELLRYLYYTSARLHPPVGGAEI